MGYIGNQPFLGTATGESIADGSIGTVDLSDGAVTAAKLATTAILDKLGYTPVSTSGTGATGTWGVSISGNSATATTAVTATNVSGGTASVTTLAASGNLTFSSTGQRITGDFSNATASNRLLFQTSTTNGNSFVGNMPNGTGSYGAYVAYNGSDPANSSSLLQGITSTDARLVSTFAGTGSYLPLTFYTGGSERMRLLSGGGLHLGTVSNATGIVTQFLTKSPANYAASAVFESDGSAANWARTDWKNANVATSGIIYMDQSGLFAIRNDGNLPMAFYTNGANERLRITAAGDVGIGTASLAGRLHARFDAGAADGYTGKYIFQTTDQRLTIGTYWQSGVGQYARIQSSTDSGSPIALLLNPDGGNVAIGATSTTLSGQANKAVVVNAGSGILGFNNSNNTNQSWNIIINDSGLGNAGRFQLCQIVNGSTSGIAGGPCVPIISADVPTTANTTPRLLIDSSGNVGIGTTAPGNSRLRVQNSSGTFGNSNPLQSWAYANFQVTNLHLDGSVNPVFNTDADSNWNPPATMIWQFRGAERMRITSGGNLLIGTTSDLGSGARVNINSGDGEADVLSMRYTSSAAGKHWRFAIDSNSTLYLWNQGGTGVYITDGGTSWIGTSDERLKTDLKPIEDSVNKICQLRAVTGRFKTDEEGTSRSFLIAQDVQKVFPEAVSAINPDELGLRYTDMIPLLVAAIKELSAKVAALEAK